MKKIRLNIPYPKREFRIPEGLKTEELVRFEKVNNPQQISLNVISSGVKLVYKDGMTLEKTKMWSKIQDRIMDDNGKPVLGDIDLSDEQFDFVYDSTTTAKYPDDFATAVTAFIEYLETIKLKK